MSDISLSWVGSTICVRQILYMKTNSPQITHCSFKGQCYYLLDKVKMRKKGYILLYIPEGFTVTHTSQLNFCAEHRRWRAENRTFAPRTGEVISYVTLKSLVRDSTREEYILWYYYRYWSKLLFSPRVVYF